MVSPHSGSGKTTQVPQFVLDDLISNGSGAHSNILVTQPRRISAIGVAERMAQERCERCGETVGYELVVRINCLSDVIGRSLTWSFVPSMFRYSIKLEKKMSGKTRLLLCTTGILLRRLMGDPDLASVSHCFVDEVHLRDIQTGTGNSFHVEHDCTPISLELTNTFLCMTDFCLIILREILKRRRNLKVILMSATLNAEAFSDYFGGCAIVTIPGRTHPVGEFRLEDILHETGHVVLDDFKVQNMEEFNEMHLSKTALRKLYLPKYSPKVIQALSVVDEEKINYPLLAELLEHICLNKEDGAILVFMPGLAEISKAIDEIRKKELFQSPSFLILPLHSTLSSSEQTAVVSGSDELAWSSIGRFRLPLCNEKPIHGTCCSGVRRDCLISVCS